MGKCWVSDSANGSGTQGTKPPGALPRLTRRAREKMFAAAWRFAEVETLKDLGRRPYPLEVATHLLKNPDRHLADIRTRSPKVLARHWARLRAPTLTRGDRELRELVSRLSRELRHIGDLICSASHQRANEKTLPPLPDTPEARALLAILRDREQQRDESIERVRRRLLAYFATSPPARPSASLPEADVIDLRTMIRAAEDGESQGPPCPPKNANASAVVSPAEALDVSSILSLDHDRRSDSIAFGPPASITFCGDLAARRQFEFEELVFTRECEWPHALVPRIAHELLAELGRAHLLWSAIEALVDEYLARLTSEMLAAQGADRLPSLIHQIRIDPRELDEWARQR